MFGICGMVRFELARSGVKLRSSTNIIQLERNQPTRSSFSAKSPSSACHNFLANMFNSRNLPVLRRRTGGQMGETHLRWQSMSDRCEMLGVHILCLAVIEDSCS